MPDAALVSCLLVTLPVAQRFRYFQRSVAAYCQQTHQPKELVIVVDRDSGDADSAIAKHVSSLRRSDIRIINLSGTLSLGRLRNISREAAHGDILCQWDDDDLHHPQRVEQQLKALIESRGEAVYLQEVMQFFPGSRTLYWTNWRATEYKGMPGTLMCRRSARIHYPETGPSSRLGEDSVVSLQLQQQRGFHALSGAPHLFVYVSHGDNSWPDEHHQMLARELSISRALLCRREAELRQGLRPFDFGPGEITVQGYNGTAFTLDAEPGSSRESPGGPPPRRTEI